jgi:hypothetical protein
MSSIIVGAGACLVAACSEEGTPPNAEQVNSDTGGASDAGDSVDTGRTTDIGASAPAMPPGSNGISVADCVNTNPDRQDFGSLVGPFVDTRDNCLRTRRYSCRLEGEETIVTSDAGCLVEPNQGLPVLVANSFLAWTITLLPPHNPWWRECTADEAAVAAAVPDLPPCRALETFATECQPVGDACPAGCYPIYGWQMDPGADCLDRSETNRSLLECGSLIEQPHAAVDCWSRPDSTAWFFIAMTIPLIDGVNLSQRGCADWNGEIPPLCPIR